MATSTQTTAKGWNPLFDVSFLMPIDRVEAVPVKKHHGTFLPPPVEDVGGIPEIQVVAYGRIELGSVKVGDHVDISDYLTGLPHGPIVTATVTAISIDGKEVDSAHAPQYVGLALCAKMHNAHIRSEQIVFKPAKKIIIET